MLSFREAILKAQEEALKDPKVILIGEGVPDPKGIFGTTKGLKAKYPTQVFDQPVSEAGVTGILIGASLNGLKPIMTHQRMDFSLYAMDQIVNNAAKWYSMFGGQRSVPLVIRMTIGRGWGQGNQHSQNLSALYAHIPGLKVFMPSNPKDAYDMFLEAVKDPNPVIFLEHKWLYECTEIIEEVEEEDAYGTIISWAYAMHEANAVREIERLHYRWNLLDLKYLSPIPWNKILKSVNKSKRLMVIEDAWETGSISDWIISKVSQEIDLKGRPIKATCPNYPCPSSHALSKRYYPSFKFKEKHDVDPFTNKVTSAI